MKTARRSFLGAIGFVAVGIAASALADPHSTRKALDRPSGTIERQINQPARSVRVTEFSVPDGIVTLTLDVTGGQPAAWIADPPDDAKVGRGLDDDLGIVATPTSPSTTAEIEQGDYALVIEATGQDDAVGAVSLAHY